MEGARNSPKQHGLPIGREVWLGFVLGYLVMSASGLVLRPDFAGALCFPRGAGVAVAFLLVAGRRQWPVIFLGALACRILLPLAGLGSAGQVGVLAALPLAGLATLQALTGAWVLRRLCGFPLRLRGIRHAALAYLVGAPLLSALTAAAGLAIYRAFDLVAPEVIGPNWLVWMVGDTVGISAVMPLLLLWPGRMPPAIYWRDTALPRFRTASFLYVILTVSATLIGWKAINAMTLNYNRGHFETLVNDSSHVLRDRMRTYAANLAGAKGLMEASDQVTQADWRTYVAALDLPATLPGLSGIGFIRPVPKGGEAAFQAEAEALGLGRLAIHPETASAEHFVIQFIEPAAQNPGALGLDIGSEPERAAAAVAARDSGEVRITRKLVLVQDPTRGAGFMLLDPVYATGAVLTTVAERRAAFRGWVYAPFRATQLMANLTSGLGQLATVRVYDGPQTDPARLVYAGGTGTGARGQPPAYRIVRQMPVFGQVWTVAWESTPAFEASINRLGPSLTLLGGLAFALLLAVHFLLIRLREERVGALVEARTRDLAMQIEENRSIIDTPSTNIALLDGEGRVLFGNASVIRLFGSSAAELAGRPLAHLLGGATAEYFSWSKRRPEPTMYRSEVRTATRTGSTIVLDVQINAWLTPEGERRFTALMTDVTDKRRVEEELRQARHRLDVALSAAKIGVFEVDLATGTSIVSGTWRTLLGFRPDEEIDTQAEFRARLHPEDRALVDAADAACIAGRAERSISEFRIRAVDGSWHWMRSEAVAGARDAAGRATRLIGAQTDITERVEGREALLASEESFRLAIQAAPIGMAIVGLDGRFARVNDALSAFAGRRHESMPGRSLEELVHPDERTTLRELIAGLLAGTRDKAEAELRCLRADGSKVWGHLSLAVVRDSHGKALNFVVQVQDIDAQKKLERAKGEFIATVSHELRTPLTSINGSLGLVLNGVAGKLPERAQKMLEIAQKNTARLSLLVNDILDMEKLTSGKMPFDFAEAEVEALLLRAQSDNRPLADAARIGFAPASGGRGLYIRVDANRFLQVMANLLSNAVKFSPPGGQVEVRAERGATTVRIAVTDHGEGVPAAFRAKIFQAFSQADSSATRAKEGTGLGLAISRQIIERMGGAIGFDSQPGHTTFWLTLPLAGTDASAAPALAEPVPVAGQPRILHVEADADFAAIVAASFGRRAKLVHAPGPAEAEPLIAAGGFDLVLIDDATPGGAGAQLIDRVLARDATIPVVLLAANESGAADPRLRHRFIKTRSPMSRVVSACLAAIARPGRTIHAAE